MPQIKLLLSASSLFLFLAAIVAVSLSIFAYRITIPPIPTGRKYLLITLRSLALFLLFILFLEPILGFIRKEERPATVAVLVDNSRSMGLIDRTGSRAEMTRRLLKTDGLSELSRVARVKSYQFADRLTELPSPDSLHFNGGSTNISAALKKLGERIEEENIQAIILLSDGNHNLGENPIHEAGRSTVPIYTIGIGDSLEQKDLLITRVLANDIVYSGSRVPVDVTVKSSGFSGERVEVSLSEGGKALGRQFLTLRDGTWEYPINFFFEPKEEGMRRYTVSVSQLEGEITAANNSKSMMVKVLKSRMKVLMIAGAPSVDVAFIKRAYMEDKNVELKTLVQKDAGSFYEGEFSSSLVSDADCIVLVGFPLSNSRVDILHQLQAEIEQRRKPLLVILSRNVDFNRLRILDLALPFTSALARRDEVSVYVQVPENQRTHPLVKLNGSSNLWNTLPPIYKTSTMFRSKPDAEVLGITRAQDVTLNEPLILARSVGGLRSVAVTGYGLWRWKLLTQSTDPATDVLQIFLSNSVRWLTTRDEGKQVKIGPTKEIFTGGEPVEFTAQVYDKTYRAVDGAEVKVVVKRADATFETVLSPLGSGRYEGTFEGLGEGEYEFIGTAVSDGERLGEESGKFSVGALDVEFLATRMNKALLQQIAYHSGGRYFDPQNASLLADEIQQNVKLTAKELRQSKEFELWSLPIMLTLLVLLFSVEWFLRKQSGML